MATLDISFPSPRKRLFLITIIAVLAFSVGYIMLLNHEEQVMEKYYKNLRDTNVTLYLSKVMQTRGFRAFLKEYLTVHDYSHPVSEAPVFLVGRWALFDKEKRVSDDFIPSTCFSGVVIEDGRLKFFGYDVDSRVTRYTMKGSTVTAHRRDASDVNIDVVGYGNYLHHIVVRTPGSSHPRYGYMCH